jgi:glutaredoxin 3
VPVDRAVANAQNKSVERDNPWAPAAFPWQAVAARASKGGVFAPSHGVRMPRVVLYTTRFCPYCLMAKRLLGEKGAAFEEIDVGGNPALRREMTLKANGRRTVPQIWIGETHVGGCDELYELEAKGDLDRLLQG